MRTTATGTSAVRGIGEHRGRGAVVDTRAPALSNLTTPRSAARQLPLHVRHESPARGLVADDAVDGRAPRALAGAGGAAGQQRVDERRRRCGW